MSNRHGLLDTILDSFVPVHSDGHKFIAIAAALSVLFFILWAPLGWVFLVIALYIAYFFRDPERVTPLREGLVVAPADGRISHVEVVTPPMELGLGQVPRVRISTFLSVFDVHINRAPVAGRIARSIYVPGAFINAAADKASEENERQHILIERSDGLLIGFTQIAGLVARRILPFVKPGDMLAAGQRVGLIRFGSRVDVYLPAGTDASVLLGQKVVAGETVLAQIGSQKLIEGVSQ